MRAITSPGVDVLVVGDRNGRDVARHLRRDGELARGDEGVVGRFEMAGVVPVEVSARSDDGQEEQAEDRGDRMPAKDPLAGLPGPAVLLSLRLWGRARPFDRRLLWAFQQPDRRVGSRRLLAVRRAGRWTRETRIGAPPIPNHRSYLDGRGQTSSRLRSSGNHDDKIKSPPASAASARNIARGRWMGRFNCCIG